MKLDDIYKTLGYEVNNCRKNGKSAFTIDISGRTPEYKELFKHALNGLERVGRIDVWINTNGEGLMLVIL